MEIKTRTINLFGTVYTIYFVNQLTNENENYLYGITNGSKRYIKINLNDVEGKPLPKSEIKLTLLHELVHAILMVGQYNVQSNDEPLVEFLARGINQIFKSNIL